MNWTMVGWSHHQTPIEIREKLAFSPEQVQQGLERLRQEFPGLESVLLSTCNRVELYVSSDESALPSHEQLVSLIGKFHGLNANELSRQAVQLSGLPAIRHLFMVASSLDSMVIGEAQILSQVRSAYELACATQTASTQMHRAFQRATAVARRIANETSIHRRRVSVPSVAISEIATEFFERFDDKKILLVGAGEMSTEALHYLRDAGAKKITIVNRSLPRAQELASQFALSAQPWDALDCNIADADLIVSTTGSPEPIVPADRFRSIRANRNHAVLILDLAVPRDFAPSIGEIADTYLYSVDDLQQVCDRNIEARKAEWPKAIEIVDEETQKFINDIRHASSGATIRKLYEQADSIKQDELKRLLDKLQSHNLDPKIAKELSNSFDRLVNKILHPPLQSLRDHADSSHHAGLLEALRRLFQID